MFEENLNVCTYTCSLVINTKDVMCAKFKRKKWVGIDRCLIGYLNINLEYTMNYKQVHYILLKKIAE